MNQIKQTAISFVYGLGQSLWVIFGFGVAAYLAVLALHDLIVANPTRLDLIFSANALGYFLAVIIVVGVAAMITRESWSATKRLLALNPAKWTKYLKVLAVFGAYIIVSQIIYFVVDIVLSDIINLNQKQNLGFTADSLVQPYQYVLAFFMLVILPPVFEEILFRGYLFGRLMQKMGFIASAIVTSFVFGLVHFNWSVSIDVFVLSLFLCYLRRDSDSIVPGMLLHGLKNGLAYFLLFIAPLLGIHLVK
ncbi:MAG TPA: CPBP family intramembrane glutamic endopeptidase [Candidatus Saccharimonadales bacterium]|nr:CPBP family intramembrane glutamic endopeptidase [Candidatus Saccharimonadales bacterium]